MDSKDGRNLRQAKRLAFSSGHLRTVLEILGMALCGGLYSMIFEGMSLAFLAWFGLIPLAAAGLFYPPRRAFLYGFVWGYVWSVCSFFWLREIMVFIPFVLSGLLGLFPALWSGIVPFLYKNLLYPAELRLQGSDAIRKFRTFHPLMEILFTLALAAWWCILEWVRSWIFTGLPWNLLGTSQWKQIGVIQICEYTGIYGISFLIVLFNVSLILAVKHLALFSPDRKYRRPYPVMFACALLLFSMILGANALKQYRKAFRENTVIFKAGVVQTDLSQRRHATQEKATEALDVCIELSNALFGSEGQRPQAVIWPETAVPYSFNAMSDFSSRYRSEVLGLLVKHQVPFVIGTILLENNPVTPGKVDVYNSALLLKPGRGAADSYSKEHIVPFGEYVPFGDRFPWLNRAVGMGRNLTRGKQFNSLELTPDVKAGVSICYEDVFSYVSGSHAKNGANLLLVITNDAWYPTSYEPVQHFANSVFRAVETRLPMIRCGNSDFSAVILPNGQVSDSVMKKNGRPDPAWRGRKSAVLDVPVPLNPKPTFYTLYGNVFIGFCALFFFFALISALLRWKQYKMLLSSAITRP